jgi:hypothetical protein
VSTWKRQAIEGMAGVFSDKVRKAENEDGEIKELNAKIDQMAVESGTGTYAAKLLLRFPSFVTRAKAMGPSKMAFCIWWQSWTGRREKC